ncbi:MAG: hypothetical protein ACRD1L_02275 [Terriglobales bacterium]
MRALGWKTLMTLVLAATFAGGQQPAASAPSAREGLAEAWFTGPTLTPSAATLPRGHALLEPYLFDVIGGHTNSFGSLTYALYGVTDRLTVGVIPIAGYNLGSGGSSSAGVEWGDASTLAQFRLAQFRPGTWVPTIAAVAEETWPTGRYDRLGDRPSDGLGSGAHTTTLGLYSQTYFWLPTGRILRMRFNLTQAFSSRVKVRGVSVYGTGAGFLGRAAPGDSSYADASWEYSLTQRWVLALDATYRHTGATWVAGVNTLDPAASGIQLEPGSSDAFALAPAVEYNWRANLGVLLGVRVIPASHNTAASLTPAVAINWVR